MKYAEFIDEVRALLDRGGKLMGCTHDTREFRNWRHEVESTVSNAERLGFKPPGEFESDARQYRALWNGASSQDDRNAFLRDMGDSLTELRFLVQQFDKYGAPIVSASNLAQQQPSAPLALPEKVTLRWLIDNVPINIWLILASVVGVVFLAGVTAGHSEPARKLIIFIEGLFGSSSVPH